MKHQEGLPWVCWAVGPIYLCRNEVAIFQFCTFLFSSKWFQLETVVGVGSKEIVLWCYAMSTIIITKTVFYCFQVRPHEQSANLLMKVWPTSPLEIHFQSFKSPESHCFRTLQDLLIHLAELVLKILTTREWCFSLQMYRRRRWPVGCCCWVSIAYRESWCTERGNAPFPYHRVVTGTGRTQRMSLAGCCFLLSWLADRLRQYMEW